MLGSCPKVFGAPGARVGGGVCWARGDNDLKVRVFALSSTFSTLHHEGDTSSSGLAGAWRAGLPDK